MMDSESENEMNLDSEFSSKDGYDDEHVQKTFTQKKEPEFVENNHDFDLDIDETDPAADDQEDAIEGENLIDPSISNDTDTETTYIELFG